MAPQEPPPTDLSNPPQATRRHDKTMSHCSVGKPPKNNGGSPGSPQRYTDPISPSTKAPKLPQPEKDATIDPFNPATTSKHEFCLIFIYHISLQIFENFKQNPRVSTFFGKDSNNTNDNNNDNDNNDNNNNTRLTLIIITKITIIIIIMIMITQAIMITITALIS